MSEPIRVLQVIGILNQGGAETMIMNLYRHIDRKKIQFDFVENENDGAFFDHEVLSLGGRIYHCPRFDGRNYRSYRKWWSDFFSEHHEYHVVHGHIGSSAAIYLREAKKHGLKTIAHSHNIDAKSIRQLAYNAFSYPTRFIADYLFMCSYQAGIDRYGKKAVREKGLLLANAIDTSFFRYDEDLRVKKRLELGISRDAFLVGHIGRFAEQKNHKLLIDIFKEIISIYPSSNLLLVGDGDLRPTIEKKVSAFGLQHKTIFAGARTDVNELLMAMDVLVFPSKYEGLPVSLVEAQCSGLPCIISNKIPSDAVLIEDLIKIRALNDNPKEWAKTSLEAKCVDRAGCAGKIREAGFDIEENAEWLEEFYLEKAK